MLINEAWPKEYAASLHYSSHPLRQVYYEGVSIYGNVIIRQRSSSSSCHSVACCTRKTEHPFGLSRYRGDIPQRARRCFDFYTLHDETMLSYPAISGCGGWELHVPKTESLPTVWLMCYQSLQVQLLHLAVGTAACGSSSSSAKADTGNSCGTSTLGGTTIAESHAAYSKGG